MPDLLSSAPRVLIRDFVPGEAPELRRVFASSVHTLARGFYTQQQLDAWAPVEYDTQAWSARISALQPFVAVVDGHVAGYADLQDSGLIDHFFVAGPFAGCGVGGELMRHIKEAACARGILQLRANVSLAAEPFFSRSGFVVARRQAVTVSGVAMSNAQMTMMLPQSLRDVLPMRTGC